MIPVLTNPNNKIKFTGKYSLIASPSTDIPERLPTKNICEISSHIFSYCFIPSVIIKVTIANMKNTTIIAQNPDNPCSSTCICYFLFECVIIGWEH